jgi:hypothetical protein
LTGDSNSLTVVHGFGAELLRLRPRSGCEYAFSGDPPRYVSCALFILLAAFGLLSAFLGDCLGLITADLWIDWLANVELLGLLILGMLFGVALAAGLARWIFHPWLQRHSLVVYQHGLMGRFPDLEFAAPFEEVNEIWLCRHPQCRDDDVCDAKNVTSSRPGDATAALRWMERIVSWYLTGLAMLFGLILAPAGGSLPELPKRQPVPKLFLVLKGGVVHPLGRFLRRFREADRYRLLEVLRSRLPEAVGSHEA